MRVAIVHDWLTGMRGGERVLEALLDVLPEAEILTLLHNRGAVSPKIEARPIHTSWLDGLPFARRRYRYFLPLFPKAVEGLDTRGFDLVVSSSHCVAKGVSVPAGTLHLCYCHTPMRYVWDQYDAYFGPGRASLPVRLAMHVMAPGLRRWDVATSAGVDRFVANSEHVRKRVARHYQRDATVVYPPVDVGRFDPGRPREDFYLIVSALVAYKRIDVAIEAFNRSGRRLVIVGIGTETDRLKAMAGPTVEFAGPVHDTEVADRMARCRGFVVTADEDFGIATVEAQAAGAPVIALGRGGSLETVVGHGADAPATGLFYDEQTPGSLGEAVERFEALSFDRNALVRNAARFNGSRFRRSMRAEIDALCG